MDLADLSASEIFTFMPSIMILRRSNVNYIKNNDNKSRLLNIWNVHCMY